VKKFLGGGEKMKIMVDKRAGCGYTNCTNTSNTVGTEREECRRESRGAGRGGDGARGMLRTRQKQRDRSGEEREPGQLNGMEARI